MYYASCDGFIRFAEINPDIEEKIYSCIGKESSITCCQFHASTWRNTVHLWSEDGGIMVDDVLKALKNTGEITGGAMYVEDNECDFWRYVWKNGDWIFESGVKGYVNGDYITTVYKNKYRLVKEEN